MTEPDSEIPVRLKPDETVICAWRLSRKAFLWRGLFASLLTVIFFGGMSLNPVAVVAVAFAVLFYFIIFENLGFLFQKPTQHWWLTNQRIVTNDETIIGNYGEVRLTEIRSVRSFMFWALTIRLKTRLAFSISPMQSPRRIRDMIREAVAAADKAASTAQTPEASS